jgi:hypothetical protein
LPRWQHAVQTCAIFDQFRARASHSHHAAIAAWNESVAQVVLVRRAAGRVVRRRVSASWRVGCGERVGRLRTPHKAGRPDRCRLQTGDRGGHPGV